jgi:hypothetical protein
MTKQMTLIILTIWQFFKIKKNQKAKQKRIYQVRNYEDTY